MGDLPHYPGDRVRISTWVDSSFNDMRGTVASGAPPSRVLVHLDGDNGPTVFFPSEVVPLEDA